MPIRNAKRPAMDGLTLDDQEVEEFIEFLNNKLSPDDFGALKNMLAKSQQSKDEAEEEEDEEEMETAKDEPPPFKGKPGGEMAADSRGKTFADRWPQAARITVLG